MSLKYVEGAPDGWELWEEKVDLGKGKQGGSDCAVM